MVGITACQEMLTAMMAIGVVAMRIAKDGKVDMSDLSQLMGLIASQGDLIAAFRDAGQIPAEIKDLTDDEIKMLVEMMLKTFHTIKEA